MSGSFETCRECTLDRGIWYDVDGVIRCEECHTKVAIAWGGDYDDLIKKRGFTPVQWVPPPKSAL
jgi:hypothetical protein